MRDRSGPAETALLFLLVVVAWSGNYLFVKVGLLSTSPLGLAALRAGVGAAGTAVYLLWVGGVGALAARDRRDALLLGIPNTAAFLGLWFVAAQRVAVGEAAVVIYTYPLWVALFTAPLLGYRLAPTHWAAVAAGFGGVVLVSEPWRAASASASAVPFAELLAAAVAWGGSTVVFQRRFRPEQLAAANGLQLVSGAAVLGVAAAVAGPWTVGPVGLPFVASLLWMGLFGTTFAYIVWFWMLERHRASTVAAYLFLVPLGALALGVVFTGEAISAPQAAGIALVLASVYAVARARRPASSNGLPTPRG